MRYYFARRQIVDVHQKLYQKGYGVDNDGNTSIRVSPNKVLITPKGFNKATLRARDISLIDLASGKQLNGPQASSEAQLHLRSYQHNPKLKAIVHSHPPHAIACSLADIHLSDPVLPEVVIALGQVPTCPYLIPGTETIAQQAAQALENNQAIILEKHGVVSGSKLSIEDALAQLERVEHTAKILWLAHAIKKPQTLSQEDHAALLNIRNS